jgi:hypothetical protein
MIGDTDVDLTVGLRHRLHEIAPREASVRFMMCVCMLAGMLSGGFKVLA